MVLLPVENDAPLLALLVKPLEVTVAVSPVMPVDQVFARVRFALRRVLVKVQVTFAFGIIQVFIASAVSKALFNVCCTAVFWQGSLFISVGSSTITLTRKTVAQYLAIFLLRT